MVASLPWLIAFTISKTAFCNCLPSFKMVIAWYPSWIFFKASGVESWPVITGMLSTVKPFFFKVKIMPELMQSAGDRIPSNFYPESGAYPTCSIKASILLLARSVLHDGMLVSSGLIWPDFTTSAPLSI